MALPCTSSVGAVIREATLEGLDASSVAIVCGVAILVRATCWYAGSLSVLRCA
jgi:hypothetical protein